MSRKKSRAVELFDNLVFAPVRYMDPFGNEPDKGWIKNLVNKPEVRMTALACAFFAVAGNGDINKTIYPLVMGSASILLYSFVYSNHDKKTKRNLEKIILDAYPEKENSAPSSMKAYQFLYEHRNNSRTHTLKIMPTAVSLLLVANYAVGAPLSEVTFTIITTYGITHYGSQWWRATRALNGEWDILDAVPPKEPAKEKVASPFAVPAPSRI